VTCRSCSAEIADKAIVCYRCGAPTADPAPASPVRASGRRAKWPWLLACLLLAAALAAYYLLSQPIAQ
jgi:hypothetical protein